MDVLVTDLLIQVIVGIIGIAVFWIIKNIKSEVRVVFYIGGALLSVIVASALGNDEPMIIPIIMGGAYYLLAFCTAPLILTRRGWQFLVVYPTVGLLIKVALNFLRAMF